MESACFASTAEAGMEGAPLGAASEAPPVAAASDAPLPAPPGEASPAKPPGNLVMQGKTVHLAELPEATVRDEDFETLAERVHETLRARGLSQNSVCAQLALSPVYFSIWLRQRPVSARLPSRPGASLTVS